MKKKKENKKEVPKLEAISNYLINGFGTCKDFDYFIIKKVKL